jgi:hypothetical protein
MRDRRSPCPYIIASAAGKINKKPKSYLPAKPYNLGQRLRAEREKWVAQPVGLGYNLAKIPALILGLKEPPYGDIYFRFTGV